MKKSVLLILIIFGISMINRTIAQDVCSTNPKYCKLLSDTAGVRMMLITLSPGAKLEMHTHPVNMIYIIKGGVLKVTYAESGKTETLTGKEGDAFQSGPETPHNTVNAGKTTIQFILVEKNK
jgi:quercetin dioxygenase-like cupin family protein